MSIDKVHKIVYNIITRSNKTAKKRITNKTKIQEVNNMNKNTIRTNRELKKAFQEQIRYCDDYKKGFRSRYAAALAGK